MLDARPVGDPRGGHRPVGGEELLEDEPPRRREAKPVPREARTRLVEIARTQAGRPLRASVIPAPAYGVRRCCTLQRSSIRPRRHTASETAQVATNIADDHQPQRVQVDVFEPYPERPRRPQLAATIRRSSIVPINSATTTDRPVMVML